MNQIGTRELETERLLLRHVRAEDAAVMFENWASDAQVTKYLTWSPHENPEGNAGVVICLGKGIYTGRLLSLGAGGKSDRGIDRNAGCCAYRA